eukprot:4725000-Pyramimonas_sp.AAC.1
MSENFLSAPVEEDCVDMLHEPRGDDTLARTLTDRVDLAALRALAPDGTGRRPKMLLACIARRETEGAFIGND